MCFWALQSLGVVGEVERAVYVLFMFEFGGVMVLTSWFLCGLFFSMQIFGIKFLREFSVPGPLSCTKRDSFLFAQNVLRKVSSLRSETFLKTFWAHSGPIL